MRNMVLYRSINACSNLYFSEMLLGSYYMYLFISWEKNKDYIEMNAHHDGINVNMIT